MQKTLLSKENIFELVRENRYRVNDGMKSRCIDGRYQEDAKLPALAYPGADAGEFLTILSSGRSYGFEVDRVKAWDTLTGLVGGEKNLGYHTDAHAVKGGVLEGCGHIQQALSGSQEYNVDNEDVGFVLASFAKAKQNGAEEVILQGEHEEGAVVFIRGNYGIYPRYNLMWQGHKKNVSVFVYHQTLADARHHLLAKALIANGAVTLPEGCDDEYLYEVLSEVSENHLLETAKRLAKGCPIYEVVFEEDGMFDIMEMGEV